jgi:hypothetical protein
MLFAFKRGGANSVDPFHRAIMQLNITPGQWLLHKQRPRIFSLRIPFAQNVPNGTSALSIDQTMPL